MQLRPTQAFAFRLVQSGLSRNLADLAAAQEQIATGRRILRPSDDPNGTATLLSLERQRAAVSGFQRAAETVSPMLSAAASELEQSSSLLSEVRSLALQALNGTLSASDRSVIADRIDELRAGLLDSANARFGDRYLFSPGDGGQEPFIESEVRGARVVQYVGRDFVAPVQIARSTSVETQVSGERVFGRGTPRGAALAGLSGAALGTRPGQGDGYATLTVRHDSTSGALGAGLALAFGGTQDTLLGDRVVVVDAADGTARLGGGDAVPLPAVGDMTATDVVLTDEFGAELHLDFSAWTGASFTGNVRGDGSISLDGQDFTTFTGAETDLELDDPATGRRLSVDTTGIVRAADDLVTYQGTTNVFDTLEGLAADLRASSELGGGFEDRVGARLAELDRAGESVRGGLAVLGARLERVETTNERLASLDVELSALISTTGDVDLTEVISDLTRAQQTLEVAQATGARLIQQTLLNFL